MKCKILHLPIMAGLILFAINLKATEHKLNISKRAPRLCFLENKGQIINQHQVSRKDIDFKLSAGNGLNVFLGSGKIEYQWIKSTAQASRKAPLSNSMEIATEEDISYKMYRMDVTLIGANRQAKVIMEEEQIFLERYYLPTVPKQGAVVRSYRKITYKDVYPHIDWVFYFNSKGQLEHDFVVRPGGHVADIKIKYGGATGLQLLDDGSLQAHTPMGTIKEKAPYSYDAQGKAIASSFKLDGDILSLLVGDHLGTLTIDPTLEWETYFGGLGSDIAYGLTHDSMGLLYMAGITSSADQIATTGTYQQTISGSTDAFISKFSPSGSLLWSTYWGGTGADRITDIRFDPIHTALYVAGATQSTTGIASTGAHQATAGGGYDVLLARFDTAGQRIWSTYYGGTSTDGSGLIAGVTTDQLGQVFLCSETNSTNNISTTGSYQATKAGSRDGFVAKFNSDGQRQWGTYLGGNSADFVRKLACDAKGDLYVAGYTGSTVGIATTGTYQASSGGGNDAFLAKFNTLGNLQWCTYYGGTGSDILNAIHVSTEGKIAIAGSTQSTNGIATSNADQTVFGGLYDGFLAIFNAEGKLNWATYMGGEGTDNISSILQRNQELYLCGSTTSNTGISFNNALQTNYGGGTLDGFIARFDSAGAKEFATYQGGTDGDELSAITLGLSYDLFACGRTNSASGIATTNSHQPQFNGGEFDIFLLQLNFCDPPAAITAIKGDTAVCEGQQYQYSADSISGGVSYLWQLPDGWQGSSDSTQISITSGANSGYIAVVAQNYCTIGDTTQLFVTVTPLPKPVIVAKDNVLHTTEVYKDYQWIFNDLDIPGANTATWIATDQGSYAVRVGDTMGCEGTSATIMTGGTAVHNLKARNTISMAPNPARQYLLVSAPFPIVLVISSIDGKTCIKTSHVDQISLEHLSAGLYFVRVYDGAQRLLQSEKLVIE